jgi:hypothetical protein
MRNSTIWMRCLIGDSHVLPHQALGARRYLQIVENTREGAKTRQSVIATLGRVDELEIL